MTQELGDVREKPRPPASSTWYVIQGGNDITWRAESPCHLLGGRMNVIPEEGGYYALTQPNEDSAFKWGLRLTLEDGSFEEVWSDERWREVTESRLRVTDIRQLYHEHEGVAVWTRPDICRATHAKAMREQHGIRTVCELDDNYLTDPKFNYFMRVNGWSKEDRLDHMKAICSMSAIVVSTDWLRDYYYRALSNEIGKKLVPPIHVCGNHIDGRYLVEPSPKRPDGKLRIGYMGSQSHIWDIKLAFPALKWAHDNGHEVVLIGHDPKWRHLMEYTYIPWQKPEEYRRMALPLDIGLAPLVVNNHTLGKSDIKAMEYLLSGAVPVVQNCEVYNRTFKHGETAWLAGSPEEYWLAVQRLVNDPKLRRDLVERGNQYIHEERMIEQHRSEWEEAILG